MFDANEARERTLEARYSDYSFYIDIINNTIERAIRDGDNFMWVSNPPLEKWMLNSAIEYYRSLGYEARFDEEEKCLYIDW